jgi:RNA polymerase sigma factor (sigma-70 family)
MGSSRGSKKYRYTGQLNDPLLGNIRCADAEFLGRDEERRLFAMARSGDAGARERLIASHFPMVIRFAGKYSGKGLEYSDLIQEGMCGLITAVDKFDVDHGYRLSTYAYQWIQQPMRRALQNRATRQKRLDAAARLPMPGLLRGEDLDPVDPSSESPPNYLLDRNDRVDLLDELLSQLPARERETIRMRFGLGGVPDNAPTPTLREIAKIRGVTAERIRVVVKTALGRLQAIAKAGGRQAS